MRGPPEREGPGAGSAGAQTFGGVGKTVSKNDKLSKTRPCPIPVATRDKARRGWVEISDVPSGFEVYDFSKHYDSGQVHSFDLPTAPARSSDRRSKGWTGGTCQLEALPPDVIADLLRTAIERRLDLNQLDEDVAAERRDLIYINRLLPAADERNGGV